MFRMIKPGPKDKKVSLLISGEELTELKRLTWLMSEFFGLDSRIEHYQGKRPIGLYSWDFECLLMVVYPVHAIIRKFVGSMTRKLSVTSSQ